MSSSDPSPDDDRTVLRPLQAPMAPSAQPGPPSPGAAGEDDEALPIGTRLGEFEITSLLGIGGFGIVYLAQDHSLGRQVAVKEYMPTTLAQRHDGLQVVVKKERHRETFNKGLESFINEARLLARFEHPALVKVYRRWEANGTAYMAMQFYEGLTLKETLKRMGTPPDEAWLRALLRPLADALSVMHAEGYWHRDVAPDNIILLADSGKPVLLDFGAARRVIHDSDQPLTVILKPGYAPPEQYDNATSESQGPWTDLYALAAVMYYAITGRTPPEATTRLLRGTDQPLTAIGNGRYSQRFLAALDQAMRVRYQERPQSVEAFEADIGLDSTPPGATSPPRAPGGSPAAAAAAPDAGRKLTWGLGIGAGALVVAAAAGWLMLRPEKPVPQAQQVPPGAMQAPSPSSLPPGPATPPAGTLPVQPAVTTPAPAAATAPTPAPTPTPAPAPGQAAAPFSMAGEFDRIMQSQSAGFDVVVRGVKSPLRIGIDELNFTLTSTRDGHVYALVLGPDGALDMLHPMSGSKRTTIRAGQTLKLPESLLLAADPAGLQDVIVIVSTALRDFKLPGARRHDGMLSLPSGPAAAALAAQHTGRASLFAGKPLNCQDSDCDAYGVARFTVELVK